MEEPLSFTPVSGTASGTLDIDMTEDSGIYFTSIFFGETPVILTQHILFGGSDSFTAVEFQEGATFSGGSIVIGSSSPSGVLQVVDLENLEVIASYTTPILETDDVEDFS